MGCVVPPLIAWRPHPPVWKAPPHFPASPVIDAVFGIQGSSCLPPRPSGLSLLYFPGLPPSASAGSPDTCASVLPHRHWPSGRSDRPLAAPRCPQISFMRVWLSATRSFAFATALLVARLAGLTRPEGLNVPSASRGLLHPGLSGHRVAPSPCRISLRRQTENCADGTFTR